MKCAGEGEDDVEGKAVDDDVRVVGKDHIEVKLVEPEVPVEEGWGSSPTEIAPEMETGESGFVRQAGDEIATVL